MQLQSFWSPRSLAATACVAVWTACALGQEADSSAERAERLAEMKRQAAEYTLTLADRRGTPLALHDEPLLRFDNAVSGVPDGIVAMWKEGNRPAVFAQIFQTKDGLWIHECQSIASAGLTMQRDGRTLWQPDRPAADFRVLGDAPAAGAMPGRRLSQLREIARQFSATDEFKIRASDAETTTHNLRLLPTPVYRYDDPSQGVVDAAVFAFVHGTDPEVFLCLEYRDAKAGQPGCYYALAPMTCWEVTVKRNDVVVWNVPERLGKSKPNDPYHVWVYRRPAP